MRPTPSIHRKHRIRRLAAGLLTLLACSLVASADDTALFSTQFPPNVLLFVDNSNSMNEIMRHPAAISQPPPGWPYAGCDVLPSSGGGTDNDDLGVGTPYACFPGFGCWFTITPSTTGFTVSPSTSDHASTGYITRTYCGQTRKIWHDGNLTSVSNPTWVLDDYLEWLFHLNPSDTTTTYGPASQTAAQILADIDDSANAQHYIGGATFGLYQRSRITAAREIARDVIYKTNTNGAQYAADCRPSCSQDVVRFGLGMFTTGEHGGFVKVPIAPYSTNATALETAINNLDPATGTPLSEALFKIYTYFMPRGTGATARPLGVVPATTTRFPNYVYNMTNGAYTTTSSDIAADPNPYACQKSFVIMITDGQPSADNFATSGNETQGFSSFRTALVGDYAPDAPGDLDIGTDGTPEEGNPPFMAAEATGYLDDIAKAMQDVDSRPDKTGVQKIDVYTIGFATDPVANVLLAKTAAQGNGTFASSWQAQELTDALVAAIDDIIVKAQAFTAATVPASRATDGNNFFTSYFRPNNTAPYWEGHLKQFEYNAKGEVLDKPVSPATVGECALEDPLAPAQCQVGRLRVELGGYWDAANEVPSAAESGGGIRKLLVSAYTSAPPSTLPATPATFNASSMTAALLTITETGGALSTLIGTYAAAGSTAGITTAENLADAITRYVRGCIFSSSTTCTDRGDGLKLWDIFHSNPVVVGPPNSGLRELAYKEFADRYAHRKRVIYAGSNGGFVHGFNTGEWDTSLTPDGYNRGTGAEEFGFMTYEARKKIENLPKQVSPKLITMDGSANAADVWFYPTGTSSAGDASTWASWHTVLISGMREGGRLLYALDVSNPPDTANPSGVTGGPVYPGYLWEFPCEATGSTQCTGGTTLPGSRAYSAYMGETWSEPIITRVKVRVNCTDAPPTTICTRYDRWVAIFGAGYDPNGDPNLAHSTTPLPSQYDSSNNSTTNREGRALFMVDIKTGKVLGMKRYDNSALLGVPDMRFAFAATPAVFDLDFDGYADVVYAADLGGNVWKWVITADVLDPINGTGDITQPGWPFVKLMSATSCQPPDGCTSAPHYRSFFFPPTGAMVGQALWLALGSGERNALTFTGTIDPQKNRFYVFKDVDPLERELTGSTSTARLTDTSASTNFVNATSLTGSCNPPPSPALGYYLEGADGEKFITDTTIFFGTVLTSSYIPTTSTDPCEVGGEAFLYGFNLVCGEGIFDPDPSGGGTEPERSISIGGGLPNRPRVSVGPVDADRDGDGDVDESDYGKVDTDGDGDIDEDDKPPCQDMAVVITSEGSAFMECPGGRPDSGVHTRSWRED
ncbi:MAG TPA: PilC/PilY family type IV pilus protein [Myxococcota bacterium]